VGIPFDTLKFVEKLESGGFSPTQARAAAEAFADATGEELASKSDLVALAAAAKADLRELRADVKTDLAETKSEILKWMFGQTLLILGAVIALSRLGH
jgi:hypothetical protein